MGDEHQHAVGANLHVARQGLESSDHQDRQKGEQDRKTNQGNEGCRKANRPCIAVSIRQALLFKPGLLQGLGGEAFDREHPAEIVREPGGQGSGMAANLPVAGSQPALKAQGSPENQGNR